MKLDTNFDAKTKLKLWWTQIKSNLQTIESEINKIENKGVVTSYIADKAVTGTKIAGESISTEHIKPLSVTEAKIGKGAVTGEKIPQRTILKEHLATPLQEDIDNALRPLLVARLPSMSKSYDFEDGLSRFYAQHKCSAFIKKDEKSDNLYQAITATSGSIGASENALARLDFSNITSGATDVTVEFDVCFVENGRWRISLCDLSERQELETVRYDTTGVATELASAGVYQFQIHDANIKNRVFFGDWLNCRFVIDFENNHVDYTIRNKAGLVAHTGGGTLRDADCSRVTGIELYTWLQNDEIWFDNIVVTARAAADERTVYLVADGDSYAQYIYVQGKPVRLGETYDMEDIEAKTSALLKIQLGQSEMIKLGDVEDTSVQSKLYRLALGEEVYFYNNTEEEVSEINFSAMELTGISGEMCFKFSKKLSPGLLYRCIMAAAGSSAESPMGAEITVTKQVL